MPAPRLPQSLQQLQRPSQASAHPPGHGELSGISQTDTQETHALRIETLISYSKCSSLFTLLCSLILCFILLFSVAALFSSLELDLPTWQLASISTFKKAVHKCFCVDFYLDSIYVMCMLLLTIRNPGLPWKQWLSGLSWLNKSNQIKWHTCTHCKSKLVAVGFVTFPVVCGRVRVYAEAVRVSDPWLCKALHWPQLPAQARQIPFIQREAVEEEGQYGAAWTLLFTLGNSLNPPQQFTLCSERIPLTVSQSQCLLRHPLSFTASYFPPLLLYRKHIHLYSTLTQSASTYCCVSLVDFLCCAVMLRPY